MKFNTNMPYDPQWLIALSRQVYPDFPELAIALSECKCILSPKDTLIDSDKDFYIRFMPLPTIGQNKCILIEADSYTIVLDVINFNSSIKIVTVEKLNNFRYSSCHKVIEIMS